MVKLGSKVRDTITGFEGIATGRTVYLNGCVHVLVTRQTVDEKGSPVAEWFDEQRVKTLEEGAFKPEPSEATAGGPAPHPPARPRS